jgi:RNA polymerase sigma-70 factor (ECF subfamily)
LEEAAAELFDRYRDRLLRMIALRMDPRIVGKVDGEDVLQDAFVAGVRRIQGYLERPSVPPFVWVRQITTQVLIDTHRRYLKAQKRDARQEVAIDHGQPSGANSAFLATELAGSLTSPSECAVREETIFALRDALERLAEIDREVLVLRHLEDLTNNEVAEVLGIDKYAASKRYLRALTRLRAAMPVEA